MVRREFVGAHVAPEWVSPLTLVVRLAGGGQVHVPGADPLDADHLTLQLLAAVDAGADPVPAAVRATGVDPPAAATRLERLRAIGAVVSRPQRRDRPRPVPTPAIARSDLRLEPDEHYRFTWPRVFLPAGGRFLCHGRDGEVLATLDAWELAAIGTLMGRVDRGSALVRMRLLLGESAWDPDAAGALLDRLLTAGLICAADGRAADPRSGVMLRRATSMRERLTDAMRGVAAEAGLHSSGDGRSAVVPVNTVSGCPPLAHGLLVGYASTMDEGRLADVLDFPPLWSVTGEALPGFRRERDIYLFSNYLWDHAENLALARSLKDHNPHAVCVFGGADVPKYEQDLTDYLLGHRQVDIAVRGEGEATLAAVLDALTEGGGEVRLEPERLREVAGIGFRHGEAVIRTEDRDRIADLDSIPSPYLSGLFDAYGVGMVAAAILETNRGCPYGCTFCDWGSATLSRIRKFDLDRVLAELRWVAERGTMDVGIADANFGIFDRDVVIAERLAELRHEFGSPESLGTNYAKNRAKNLDRIVGTLADAGILVAGKLSLQSVDPGVLGVIDRSNIRTERYEWLEGRFRRAGLAMYTDIMLGLPGSTPETFRRDVQYCVDHELWTVFQPTQVLVNSPMNEPAYREKHGIVAAPGELVKQCATFTEPEWNEMSALTQWFHLFENLGVLRLVDRWVRQEVGLAEVAFWSGLAAHVGGRRTDYPATVFALDQGATLRVPHGSWHHLLGEVRRYLTVELGLADDSALEAVFQAQTAMLPDHERVFPDELALPHDVVAWFRSMLDLKAAGHHADWTEHAARLADHRPGGLVVSDPGDVSRQCLGPAVIIRAGADDWELASPLNRSLPALGAGTPTKVALSVGRR